MGITYLVRLTGTVSVQLDDQRSLQEKELTMQLPSRRYHRLPGEVSSLPEGLRPRSASAWTETRGHDTALLIALTIV